MREIDRVLRIIRVVLHELGVLRETPVPSYLMQLI
jgi:hypothetical protein